MIASIWFENSDGIYKKFKLADPQESGYAVTEITGLSDMDVDLKMTQLASGNRFVYNKGFKKIREISIKLRYMDYNAGNKSIQQLREDILALLRVDDLVKIAIITDKSQVRYIEGYVASHQADIFSKECQSTIKIQCPDLFLVEGESYNGETHYRPKIYSKPLTNGSTIIYNGTILSWTKFTITPASGHVAGNIQFGIEKRGVQSVVKFANIPTDIYKKIIVDFNADIPKFEGVKDDDSVEDVAKYVDLRALISQTTLPSIFPGANHVISNNNSTLNTVEFSVRYLGV